jgi:hypothetical protein
MATIYTDNGSMPVRLRNLSAKGALAEGSDLPSVGEKVRLCRGSLEIAGELVWCEDGSQWVTTTDLLRLKKAVEILADALADDPSVLERHGSRLQVLDAVAQTLRKLAIQQG